MKKLILFIFIIPSIYYCQVDSTEINTQYKHEIGTNFSTFFVGLLNPTADIKHGNFTLMYKYYLSEKLALRIIPSATRYTIGWEAFGRERIEALVSETGGVQQQWRIETYHQDSKPQINIGVEKIKPISQRVKLFYGSDLFYAYQSKFFSNDYEVRKYDTVSGNYLLVNLEDKITLQKNDYETNYIGISPFIGIKYSFSKRFYLSANFNVNVAATFTKQTNLVKSLYSNKIDVSTKHYNGFETWSHGYISDLSLSYRF